MARAHAPITRPVGVLAIALMTAGLACSSSNDAGPAAPVDVVNLYGQMCARCHGADGRGDPEIRKTIPAVRDFADPQFRARGPEDIEQVIMAGKNQMPAFGGALSRPKIQHLGGYVRHLGELASRGEKAAP